MRPHLKRNVFEVSIYEWPTSTQAQLPLFGLLAVLDVPDDAQTTLVYLL